MRRIYDFAILILLISGFSNLKGQCDFSIDPIVTDQQCDNTPGSIDLQLTGGVGPFQFNLVNSTEEIFADSLLSFSSEYDQGGWSARQILGEPKVYPDYGDIVGTWAVKSGDRDTNNFISVGYSQKIKVEAVKIYETNKPGAIDSIYFRNAETDEWLLVWSGVPFEGEAESNIFSPVITSPDYLVNGVRFSYDGAAHSGYNEYDAIGLVGVAYFEAPDGVIRGLEPGDYEFNIHDLGADCEEVADPITVGREKGLLVTSSYLLKTVDCFGNSDAEVTFTVKDEVGDVTHEVLDKRYWADSVINFSTEYAESPRRYSAAQILGEPDVYPEYGDIGEAYLPEEYDVRNWISVGYSTALENASEVHIYETYGAGAVDTVYVKNANTDEWIVVWSGASQVVGGEVARIFKVKFNTLSFPINGVRIAIDGASNGDDYNEYDAIAIISKKEETGFTISGLGIEDRELIIRDEAGCIAIIETDIQSPEKLELQTQRVGYVGCKGDTARIRWAFRGGVAPYTVDWGDLDPEVVTEAGYYPYTLTDANGCVVNDSVRVSGNYTGGDGLTVEVTTTSSGCQNNNGSVRFEISGAQGAYQLDLDDVDTNALSPGRYSYIVSDESGCELSGQYLISDSTGPEFTVTTEGIKCAGDINGKATLNFPGDTTGYTVDFLGFDPNALWISTHIVSVEDSMGCTTFKEFVIGGPTDTVRLDIFVTDVLCNGDSNGTARFELLGGTAPYEVTHDPIVDHDSLKPGIYQVMVVDSNGCELTKTYEVNEPEELTMIITEPDTVCNGAMGRLVVQPEGGTPEYDLNIDPIDMHMAIAGEYPIVLTDANGCQVRDTIWVEEFEEMDLTITETQTVLEVAEAGAAYQWLDCNDSNRVVDGAMSQSFEPEATGSYSVEVSKNGCVDTSNCQEIVIIGLVENEELQTSVYPNPMVDQLNVLLPPSGKGVVVLTDVEGRRVRQEDFNGATTFVWDVSTLKKGVYQIVVSTEDGIQTSRVVKL